MRLLHEQLVTQIKILGEGHNPPSAPLPRKRGPEALAQMVSIDRHRDAIATARAFAATQSADTKLLLILGSAGVGKTALIWTAHLGGVHTGRSALPRDVRTRCRWPYGGSCPCERAQ